MDLIYLGLAIALWVLMAGLAWAAERLAGGRDVRAAAPAALAAAARRKAE